MRETIRVLHIVGAMYPGGMENFIMNLYRHIDRERFQFDFIVHEKGENDLCGEIEALGGRVYLLPRLTRRPLANLRMIREIVRENHYPVVIRHTANALAAPQLLAAKRGGAVTVCHSHNETDPQQLLHRMGRILMRRAADVRKFSRTFLCMGKTDSIGSVLGGGKALRRSRRRAYSANIV